MITFKPDFVSITPDAANHSNAWYSAMDWARLEVAIEPLKAAFVEWNIANEYCDSNKLAIIPAWKFQTIGRIALLINSGAIPPESTTTFFMQKIHELDISPTYDTVTENSESVPELIELTIKQKRVLSYVNLYSFVDAVRVKFINDDEMLEKLITDRFRSINPNRQLLKLLYNHFKESMDDAIKDRDNVEVAKTINGLIVSVNVIAGFSGNAKIVNQSKKATSKAQKTSADVTVKTFDIDTNIASISPSMIPGSSATIIYNTKYRKVSMYVAKSDSKLSIKGTKIIDYDELLSFTKTLRKPKTVLPSLRNAKSYARIEIILNQYVKGKNQAVPNRISKDAIIIKVFK